MADASFIPSPIMKSGTSYPFLGAVNSATGRWLWRIINPINTTANSNIQVLLYNAKTKNLLALIATTDVN